ncbi:SusC/RagA family TonB-linked outer membrane protein [Chitinophaga sp. GCM10012297]|uniref:SusC/RagA family TonB-linked outer membrane protein n=1 Tax=Chitinophaga chungangae TaxID=2821488 RepID=A0ABS3YAG5_9BACT|nr:SusC/RagA family TonB-linked outer membrane protein [Chitinophaga chungangae]MBO9151671.1 SusC/RagA family TonB-linked outer membrane protein [Chitinophaga chungangae]
MKLTIALLLTTTLQVMAYEGNSQDRVSVDFRETRLTRALKEVEKRSAYRFVFSNLVLDEQLKVTLEAKNMPVTDLLRQLLTGTGLTYSMLDNDLVVIKKAELPAGVITVKGKVTDSKGVPLPGVTVMAGPNKGTVCNADGEYTIQVDEDGSLSFSFIGYTTQTVKVDKRATINIVLVESTDKELGEIVVVGYGSVNKRDLTSAVTNLRQKDLIAGAVSPLLAIQGKVPGLTISTGNNGTDPNAGVTIQLRGVNSINAAQGPLIVIDGIPGGSINSVVREDIESINVLRDASAAAIYGTRASGGVILITTKKAKAGQTRVTLTSELFMETVRRRPESLSAEEFLEHKIDADKGARTDWYDEVTNKNPLSQRYVLNVNGGTENAQVYATFMARDAKGMAIESRRKEISGRLNTNFRFFDGFAELSTNISYSQAKADFSDNEIFNMALLLNPTESPYDPNDVTGLNVPHASYDYFNPVAEVRLRSNQTQYKYLLASSTLKLHLTKDLFASGMVAIKNNTEHNNFYRSSQHRISRAEGYDGYASQSYSRWDDRTLELTLNYNKVFGNHSINAVGGYTYQDFNGQGFNANNSDFPVDGIRDNDMGTGTYLSDGRAGIGSWKNASIKLIAFFGRVNYSYRDKYIFTGSLRHEGSGKFAPGNQWGTFPGVSAAWRITEEPFLKGNNVINNLKLRGGYGATGNEGFDANVATRMYGPDTWWRTGGDWIKTYGVLHNQNKDIRWEVKKEYNVGLDFAFFDNRLTGRFDLYKRKVDDMIYNVEVSQPPAIHNTTTVNVGSMENRGYEIELNMDVVRKENFNYTTGLIAASNRSRLITLNGGSTFIDRKSFPAPGSPGTAVRLYPGEDIGRFFIWKSAGFSPEGSWLLYDKDGKPFDVATQQKKQEDKYFVGNAIPRLILSWNHTISWKQFDAGVYFRSWLGYDVFNMIDMYYGVAQGSKRNVLRSAYGKNSQIKKEKELSDYWLEKGDFVKLDALSVGYTFKPGTVKPFEGLRLYATARDLFVITKYTGLDPEVNINGLEPGFEERNVYPRTRTFMLGAQVNF